MVKQAR
jgi:hypothetical protein